MSLFLLDGEEFSNRLPQWLSQGRKAVQQLVMSQPERLCSLFDENLTSIEGSDLTATVATGGRVFPNKPHSRKVLPHCLGEVRGEFSAARPFEIAELYDCDNCVVRSEDRIVALNRNSPNFVFGTHLGRLLDATEPFD